jgi:glyoxylase-like metal-dependent hydrolase (beta-lactamase superfamily II)
MTRIFALSAALALAFAGAAAGATEIAPGIDLVPGRFVPGIQPDGNSIVLRGKDGLIVVDTGRHPEHTQAVIDFARQAHLPVKVIVNSHWHLDHIGGNVLLRQAYPGVEVYASAALGDAPKDFLDHYREQLVEAIGKATDAEQKKRWQQEVALLDSGPATPPDVVVSRSGERDVAGRTLDLELESYAVTAGDVWIFDPETRVLISGDLVTLPVPLLDTACPEGWRRALGHLAERDFSLLIPGHGPPLRRPEFDLYRTAFDHLLACGASSQPTSACADGWLADAASLVSGEDPAFVRSLLGQYVDYVLRADPESRARFCGR